MKKKTSPRKVKRNKDNSDKIIDHEWQTDFHINTHVTINSRSTCSFDSSYQKYLEIIYS